MAGVGAIAQNSKAIGSVDQINLSSEGLLISPNPAKGNFSLWYDAPGSGIVMIRISDISGREFSVIQKTVSKGQNIFYMENMPSWKPGMYLVSVQQGKNIQRGKLLYQ